MSVETPVGPGDLLLYASRLLERGWAGTEGWWPRAVAVLTRQALEQSLADLWAQRDIDMGTTSAHAQLLCASTYLRDKELGADVMHAWWALSRACHHHPHELAPTASELRHLVAVVSRLVDHLRTADVVEDPVLDAAP